MQVCWNVSETRTQRVSLSLSFVMSDIRVDFVVVVNTHVYVYIYKLYKGGLYNLNMWLVTTHSLL